MERFGAASGGVVGSEMLDPVRISEASRKRNQAKSRWQRLSKTDSTYLFHISIISMFMGAVAIVLNDLLSF